MLLNLLEQGGCCFHYDLRSRSFTCHPSVSCFQSFLTMFDRSKLTGDTESQLVENIFLTIMCCDDSQVDFDCAG